MTYVCIIKKCDIDLDRANITTMFCNDMHICQENKQTTLKRTIKVDRKK